jgi:hypothetical protein
VLPLLLLNREPELLNVLKVSEWATSARVVRLATHRSENAFCDAPCEPLLAMLLARVTRGGMVTDVVGDG